MKIQDAGMVLEEQPDKAGEAIRLFLQGLGYTLRNGRSKSVSEATRKLSLNITGHSLIKKPFVNLSSSCFLSFFRILLISTTSILIPSVSCLTVLIPFVSCLTVPIPFVSSFTVFIPCISFLTVLIPCISFLTVLIPFVFCLNVLIPVFLVLLS